MAVSSAFGGSPHAFLRCRSSVVEHSLGKGEVDSSILSGSTIGSNRSRLLQVDEPATR